MNKKVKTESPKLIYDFSFVSEDINNSRFRNICISPFFCFFFFLVDLVGLLPFLVDRPALVL